MERIRILHVMTQAELGGAQQSTLELLRRLSPTRYQCTLAIGAGGGPLEADARAISGLEVHRVRSLERPIRPWRDIQCFGELTPLMRAHRFEIVHSHSSKAGILGRWAAHRAGVPAIFHTIHGFAFHPEQPAWIRRTYQAAERVTARITTRLIHVSRHDARVGLSARIGHPAQYQHIPYGIDLKTFHPNGLTPQAARARLGLRPHAPTIGTVACFKPQKAPRDFLAVCARLRERIPDIQCVMVGDGSLRAQIERDLRALGLEDVVHLLGWQRDIPRVLTAFDVFLLTSRWEGLPVAVLEAQAMGVAVVATDTGGVRDCIDDEITGYLVPIGDVEGLSHRVVTLLRNPQCTRTISARARANVAARFTIDRMVKDVEAMYAQTLESGGAAVHQKKEVVRSC